MELGYACALVLAPVFAWAGLAKLRDRGRTAVGFAALGLPAPRRFAVAVPVVELALAAGLVLIPAPAAWVALALLVGFTLVLARALAAGVRVGCGCFGASRRERVGPVDIARNGVLAAAAVVATGSEGPVWPGLDALVLVTVVGVTAMVGLALIDLRSSVGPLLGARPDPASDVFAGLPPAPLRERAS